MMSGQHRNLHFLSFVSFLLTSSSPAGGVEIRLAGRGSTRCSGRVEIYHNNTWGTVCDDSWDLNNADVVCRELGCGVALSALESARFSPGTGQIWLDDVNCSGTETSLSECQHGGFGTHDCQHNEDAGVVCSGVRLVGSTRCSGRVEIYHNNTWGTVCDDNWDFNDAKVVCRELGCGVALSAPQSAFFGPGTGQIWLDNVNCSGSETSLSECQHGGFGTHNCQHNEDAGVVCSGVRLVGSTRCSGRVEIYHNKTWGTVCDDNWDFSDAEVVCRELGCGVALSAPQSAHFGEGTGQIWLDEVDCSGSETSLSECQHGGFGIQDCQHAEDAGVVCSGVRLVGPGSDQCSGRVEIYHSNTWGTVCDDDWDFNDAKVVCRELGCGVALSAPQSAFFGPGTGQIWLRNVNCSGSETSLNECQHGGFGTHDCGHGEDAGVVCSGVRLVGSTRCSGRVEIYHSNTWGTVCDDNWDFSDAEVVCRELGCGVALNATQSAFFGQGTGQIWLDEVKCSGSEMSLTECQHGGFGKHNCGHGEDAGVVCSVARSVTQTPTTQSSPDQAWTQTTPENTLRSSVAQPVEQLPIDHKIARSSPAADGVRLVGPGSDWCSGRVEIYHSNTWGTVCDDSWDFNDAKVVCRELGCGVALNATQSAHFGPGTGQIWLDNVDCSGTETSLSECQHRGFGTHNCQHNEDAGVVCSGVRLVGSTRCSGRVEIYHNKTWGTVCDDSWDFSDAEVVCRELGCGTALSAPHSAHFGEGTGQIWLDEVKCSGTETSLTECQHGGFGTHNCQHNEDAGVVCSGVRLVGPGSDQCSGRVEIYHNNTWGTVCDDDWDFNDAKVVCRELGCGVALSAPQSAFFGPGIGQIWLRNVNCSGSETSLNECQHGGFGTHDCGHGEDAGVVCSGVRLVGSTRCSGRVEIYHDYTWGTVCDNGWDLNDAKVVCRELDCGVALSAPHSAHFGEGTGHIWLNEVDCSGSERSLSECQHRGFGTHNCGHGEDAGVVCSGSENLSAGFSLCLVRTVMFSVGLIVMVSAVIGVHLMDRFNKQK
ncbi:deleted in malignant brain tumors 1 protein isoform X4 [Lates calcarifer]|uniref:Soluble scavenger receptor cysteine-rich domain-containing protein SSC5D n=1 Tax=Lates calcarifer TaxID=8187 RepID=A0AAJ8DP01_LATCA|nr:deleted in malignant brain tumors 1 protein isoform X4 [Lates calcarifer]